VELLRTHDVDWIYQASIHLYPQIRDLPDARIVWMQVNGYYGLLFNTQSPSMRNPLVRRAVAFAIDKQYLVKTTMFGQQTVATADIPNWSWAYDRGLRSQPYDPNQARALLARAGYTSGRDGVMTMNGTPLTVLLANENSNATYRQLAVQVQAALRGVGIQALIKQFPGVQFYAPAAEGGILQSGKYDVAVFGWYAGIDPDDSAQFTCRNVAPAGYNYARYCNPEMDAAQTMALTHYDQATRKRAYATTQALLVRDVPQMFFNYLRQMEPISVDFKGLDPNTVEENWNAWQWSI
jgi:ABC-type transport system substrate-binding protein